MNTAPPKRLLGALVFDIGTVAAAASGVVVQKNNRAQPFIVTGIGLVNQSGANSHPNYSVQVRDDGTGQDWFSNPLPAGALGVHETSGIIAGDQASSLRDPWPLPAPFEVKAGNQLRVTVTNNSASVTSNVEVVLFGFYQGV